MSNSPNLPAGFSLTAINGFGRCTAVPRTATTLTGSLLAEASSLLSAAALSSAQSTTPILQTTTSQATIAQETTSASTTSVVDPPAATSVSSTTGAAPLIAASTTSAIQTSSSAEVSTAESTSIAKASTTFDTSTRSGSGSTETSTTVPRPIAQSEVTSLLSPSTIETKSQSTKSTTSSAAAAINTTASGLQSATSGIVSNPQTQPGPIIGGVFGGLALIGLIGLIFWLIKRRRRNKRGSLLTPLTAKRESEFYEIDRGSVGPTTIASKWKQQLSIKSVSIKQSLTSLIGKVLPARSDTPSVNMDRGNSQFIDGPIPQHSRNNSVLSNPSIHTTFRERAQDWYERIKDTLNAKRNRALNDSADPFASALSNREEKANVPKAPDFSQLLGMDDRELLLEADRRRASISTNQIGSGSLGLNFSSSNEAEIPLANPAAKNPFIEPPAAAAARPTSNYVHQVRHSRGQSSISSIYAQPNPRIPSSRYPSTVMPLRDSYRSTMYSTTTRKVLGRSDPFDLERPELWRPSPLPQTNSLVPEALHPVRENRIASQGGESYTSNYTSRVSNGSLDMWGDPGPDVEPGSVSRVSSVSSVSSRNLMRDPRETGDGNVSPVSALSSRAGVGKAV